MSLIPAFAKGMARTLKHAVGTTVGDENITVQYPEEEKARPVRFRGRHILNRLRKRFGTLHRLFAVRGGVSGGSDLGRSGRKRS